MKDQDYIRDISEIRSMMERSSKFLSLSGWAGILAGVYALAGAWVASYVLDFNPDAIVYSIPSTSLTMVIVLATVILILAIGTAIWLSGRNAIKKGENIWNATSRRLAVSMAVPLVAGGTLILILFAKGLAGLMAPFTLLFYGLALYNAGKFTFNEVKYLGMIQIGLGLLGSWFVGYGLLLWAIGFGIVHIAYGIHIHFKYEQ